MFGDYLITFLLFATLGVLMAGIVLMSVGGKLNARYANRLMTARVMLQGLTLLLLALLFMAGSK